MNMKKAVSVSVEPNVYADFDNGRRGEPKPGCDCVQCFGRCLTDDDEADAGREKSLFDQSAPE